MSPGKDEFPTMSGKHLVLGKAQKVVMDSRTNGIPLDSAEGYLEDVFWDTQISSTGEYVHAAPWSVSSQGRENVSHGCINLSDENAEWFFNLSQRGDIVEVTRYAAAAEQRHRHGRLEDRLRRVAARAARSTTRSRRPKPAIG